MSGCRSWSPCYAASFTRCCYVVPLWPKYLSQHFVIEHPWAFPSTWQTICVRKTSLMHYLSSVYFVNQPLHVSGVFVAHHQEVHCMYTRIGTCFAFQLTVCWPGSISTRPTDSQLKSTTHTNCIYTPIPTRPTDIQLKSTTRTNCCIHTAYLLMMGYRYARNM